MMEVLDTSHNEIRGMFPSELGNMENLMSIFLGHNNFRGLIPEELANCKDLQHF